MHGPTKHVFLLEHSSKLRSFLLMWICQILSPWTPLRSFPRNYHLSFNSIAETLTASSLSKISIVSPETGHRSVGRLSLQSVKSSGRNADSIILSLRSCGNQEDILVFVYNLTLGWRTPSPPSRGGQRRGLWPTPERGTYDMWLSSIPESWSRANAFPRCHT